MSVVRFLEFASGRVFLRAQSGSVGVFFALLFGVLLVAGGGAVDYWRATDSRADLQRIVDAAAIATARSGATSQSERLKFARQFVATSLEGNFDGALTNLEIVDYRIGGIEMTATADVETTLARVVGIDTLTVEARTAVVSAPSAAAFADVALVLDTGASMEGPRLGALKDAANTLIADVEGFGVTKLSVVPFNGYVNVGLENRDAGGVDIPADPSDRGAWWSGCVGSLEYPANTRADVTGAGVPGLLSQTCGSPLARLSDDYAGLRATIKNLNASGKTYAPAGLVWGWRTLAPGLPFPDSATRNERKRKLVLMSNGNNAISKQPGSPRHDGKEVAAANALTLEICANIKAAGIAIHTIAFQVTNADAREVLRACASEKANYFHTASTPDELGLAFRSVLDVQPSWRLVE